MNQKFGWTGSLTATAYCDRTAFYNGTALMGTVTQAPYSIVIPGIAAGTYQLSAQVTDGYGIMATSSVVTITVMAGSTTGTTGTEQLYDISTDQLDTPRQITDQNGTVVWSWDGEAFGSTPPNANPSGTGSFTFNLRFPGQYFDGETNLNQNAYRDYDPSTGRYVESDPLGFGGGQLSTYSYVGGNPVSRVDPLGLWAVYIGGLGSLVGGPLATSAGGGFVFDSSGGVGTYVVNGVGGGTGGLASFGLSFGFVAATTSAAPAATITDLGGPFANGSAGAGLGPSVTVDAFADPDNPIAGGGLTVGAGVGGGFSIQATNTTVTPITLSWSDFIPNFITNKFSPKKSCP